MTYEQLGPDLVFVAAFGVAILLSLALHFLEKRKILRRRTARILGTSVVSAAAGVAIWVLSGSVLAACLVSAAIFPLLLGSLLGYLKSDRGGLFGKTIRGVFAILRVVFAILQVLLAILSVVMMVVSLGRAARSLSSFGGGGGMFGGGGASGRW